MGKTLLVRIVFEYSEKTLEGFIITFDDVTALMAAQRKAAWADVARRIAHEIKNPLTPIQLSAERLRRKYSKQIDEDRESFDTCIDTIVRQVDHMERLVSEFSSFARMPSPSMSSEDLIALCQQAVFLQKTAYPEIVFEIASTAETLPILCDGAQINQVLTNLLKNAIDSITHFKENLSSSQQELFQGEIAVHVVPTRKELILSIEDNGEGFPENKHHLLDPYVTLREKGTGLGLAIVKKIVEDHAGTLALENRKDHGACVRITFPIGILVKTGRMLYTEEKVSVDTVPSTSGKAV